MLGAFSIGGFVDDELDGLLQIDGFDESSLYLVAIWQTAQCPSRSNAALKAVTMRGLMRSKSKEGAAGRTGGLHFQGRQTQSTH